MMPDADEGQPVRLVSTWHDPDVGDDVARLPWNSAAQGLESEPGDRTIRQRLRAEITGEDQEQPRIGRFTVLHKLGAGAMGTVYAARDDELDRNVALKLLHPTRSDDPNATHRLLREAQALAKLSHPNLVPVFEVGDHEGQVFLAMELVQGQTLQRWAHDQARPWPEQLRPWLEVGRALVAVHDAGLVHRDVKPTNVLIGDDGRTRLVDFGLARGQQDAGPLQTFEEHPSPSTSASGSSRLLEVVTHSRAVIGTPAYMAPEVRWGDPAGPSSDQYSLCVGLYESLFGRRPSLVTNGEPLAMPADVDVPPALRRLLRRGLAFDPQQRYPSMRALTEAMERILGYRRPRWVAGLGALALAAGLGGLTTWALTDPAAATAPPPCAGVEDDLQGIWDPTQRAAMRDAIEATALPYGPALATTIDQRLEGYAEQWLQTRRDACEATHVEQVQSPDLLDRRMACLDEQRRQLASVVEAGTVVNIAQASRLPTLVATTLADPRECMSDLLVTSPLPPPRDDQRDAVAALRSTLASLRTTALLAGPKDAMLPAEQALADAERIGYVPLVAEAALVLGRVYQAADDPRARGLLERAANTAESIDHVSAKQEAQRRLIRVAIDIERDLPRAERALARATATSTRMDDPPRVQAAVIELRALLATKAGHYEQARADLRTAIGMWSELGDRFAPQQANAWVNLGDLLSAAGQPEQARQAFERAHALTEGQGVGLDTTLPNTQRGQAELVEGQAQMSAGRLDEAEQWLDRAYEEGSAAYGDDSVFIARVAVAQADLALRRGRLDDCERKAITADAILRRWLGDDQPIRASSLSAVGTIAFHRGRSADAVDAFAEALRLWRLTKPDDALDVGMARSNLGEALVAVGEHDRAERELTAALTVLEARLDPDHSLLGYPAHGLAQTALHRGDLEEAARFATRALEIREAESEDPVERARTRWLLAQIRGRQGDEDRARALAMQAREEFTALGEAFAPHVREIETWQTDPRTDPRTAP